MDVSLFHVYQFMWIDEKIKFLAISCLEFYFEVLLNMLQFYFEVLLNMLEYVKYYV
jgi:hypothetical protein